MMRVEIWMVSDEYGYFDYEVYIDDELVKPADLYSARMGAFLVIKFDVKNMTKDEILRKAGEVVDAWLEANSRNSTDSI